MLLALRGIGGICAFWGAAGALAGAEHVHEGKESVFDPLVGDLRAFGRLKDTLAFDKHEVSSVDIDALIANMTLREKVAQMTQLDIYSMMNGEDRNPATALNRTITEEYAKLGIGSILNAPFPGPIDGRTGWDASEWQSITDQIKRIYRQHSKIPMIYGIDTIHGATYVRGATLFGQPLSAASSFNPDLVFKMGEIEAKDTLAAGIPWIFSPILGIAVQPKWSRVYETFGEDPYLVSQMGTSIIQGIQQSGQAAACMKHFIGYSNPIDGLDRADNVISDFDLLNYFAPSFLAAAQAGVKSAMETYVSINGYPVIASHKILTDLLRTDMAFSGMLVSDYSEIDRMQFEHHLVATVDEAVQISLTQTSLDMNMGPKAEDYFATVERLVQQGLVPESRIDESVRRILALKKDLGLFEEHSELSRNKASSLARSVGSEEDQAVALSLAHESVILLKNNGNTLPIELNAEGGNTTIFVTGPISDNKGFMCGGWSVFWSGSSNSSHFPNGCTLKEAISAKVGVHGHVEHLEAVDVDGNMSEENLDKALAIAKRSKYTVVVLGEGNYAEKGGDIDDLALPEGQRIYLRALTEISSTQVILVLITGRARTLGGTHEDTGAIVASFLPCEQGGQAIADVLFGDVNPSGKLPITYPKHAGNAMPYFHRVNTVCQGWQDCEVEWPFGYGLSYSQFTYSNLRLNATHVDAKGSLQVQVTVKNEGPYDGDEVVLLFLTQSFRLASAPEAKMLKRFEKIHLASGESRDVRFTLGMRDWSYYAAEIGQGFPLRVEPGEFIISIQQSVNGEAKETDNNNPVVKSVAEAPIRDRGGNRPSGESIQLPTQIQSLSASFHIVGTQTS
ncbi:hypothetical protein Poli38472_000658 [Pythium oligandrum]|uniref:beta-glucosidase n=1 Tax=Pythium oligandrum TaxID=41045 RepID=A0A8K1FFJ3_PYTOL|nr:hypothetical protein Poli38472_000658 [Pythium oligandrum]|eukprot:TMW60616.1 hypothetical protein Poli38472_000658 [Pythium oligandrum]